MPDVGPFGKRTAWSRRSVYMVPKILSVRNPTEGYGLPFFLLNILISFGELSLHHWTESWGACHQSGQRVEHDPSLDN